MPEAKGNMLEKFLSTKRKELQLKKEAVSFAELEGKIQDKPVARFGQALQADGINIIAEIKYASPSRGSFNNSLKPDEIASGYAENGAAAISVLTDTRYFSGDLNFIDQVHNSKVNLPLLRKDFIIDPYQILEAKVHGASAFLLIVSCLSKQELRNLIAAGQALELEALVEIHDEKELDIALGAGARIIGINNRNLDDLSVNVDTSFQIIGKVGDSDNLTFVSESGLTNHSTILELRDAGFDAFLIGSYFMESQNPGKKLKELIAGAYDN